MKGLRIKKSIRNKTPLAFFYVVVITMAILVSNCDLNKKSATESEVQIAQINELN